MLLAVPIDGTFIKRKKHTIGMLTSINSGNNDAQVVSNSTHNY